MKQAPIIWLSATLALLTTVSATAIENKDSSGDATPAQSTKKS